MGEIAFTGAVVRDLAAGSMAIIFWFNVVVARKSEIEAKYPGGLAQFRSEWMPKPRLWREDNHLLARSAMGAELKDVAERLKSLGVDVLTTNESVPPAENVKRCGWLDWDVYERREIKSPNGFVQVHEVTRHWLKGTEPGETFDFGPKKA
jgi:hypothetical protein